MVERPVTVETFLRHLNLVPELTKCVNLNKSIFGIVFFIRAGSVISTGMYVEDKVKSSTNAVHHPEPLLHNVYSLWIYRLL